MAGRIKGITVEIEGNTSGLEKSLKSVNDTSVKLNKELKDVNKLLKFDPGNQELVAQKQDILTKSIENTSKKLNALKEAQAQVDAQFKSGAIDETQYRAFQREVAETEQSLKSYQSQMSKLQTEQDNLVTNTKRLDTLFEATGTSVDDFSDILGTRLTNAIKDGTASSDQLEQAINKIGRSAIGQDGDINKLKASLDSIDDGGSIDDVRNDLEELSPAAANSEDKIDAMADSIAGGALAKGAEIVSNLTDKIVELGVEAVNAGLESESAYSKFNATTNLTKEEIEQLKDVATDVFKAGVTDNIEEAVDATSTMKSAFSELNNTELTKLTEQVITLSERTGTDVTENARAAQQLMGAFGLSAEEAFDLVATGYQNGLNYSGDFTDTLNEYAPLFEQAGYSAEDMLTILQNGMENGAMNTDKAADAIKEMQIRMGDGSFEGVMENFSTGTQDMFQKWKDGDATVAEVTDSIAQDMKKMSPSEQQEALSLLSTQFEDLGIDAVASLFNVEEGLGGVEGAMDKASEADPSTEWQSSWNEFSTALQGIGSKILEAIQPILDMVTDLVSKFEGLDGTSQTIIVWSGIIIGALALITPVIMSLVGFFTLMSGAIGLVSGALTVLNIGLLPLIAIIVAVIAVIALIVLAIQNWGAITDWLSEKWQIFKDWLSQLWDSISTKAGEIWSAITLAISNFVTSCITTIQGLWDSAKNYISGIWNSISTTATTIWNNIKTSITDAITNAKNKVSDVVNGIKTKISGVWEDIKSTTSRVWNSVKEAIEKPINRAKEIVRTAIDTIKGLFDFNFSWPHMEMPHFSISGSMNPLKWLDEGVPSISVDWYAKGGILTKPTVFGQNGNSLMVGGEAGKEAVAPLSDLMAYVQAAVKAENETQNAAFLEMIKLLREIKDKDTTIVMNKKIVAKELASDIKKENDKSEFQKNRGRGLA